MHRLTRYHALVFMALALLIGAALRFSNLTALPPGVHYDEAAYGVNAIDIGLRGERPIFIPDFTGREPLFLYLAGGMMRVLGPTLFSLRLTSAFVGLLTIAATYWLGREMLADRRIALLAAALLAVSFWHLMFSRLGFRVISQPLLQALAAAALFRGLRRNSWPWLVIAGAFLGLSAYTYLGVRLFPVLLLLGTLPLLIGGKRAPGRWQQLLLAALVALVVVLPLAGYFLEHPDAFWTRIGQVSPGDGGLSLGESFLRSFGMFFLSGDPYVRFNLPERPLFDFIWGGLLLVGWLFCLLRLRRQPYDWQQSALMLLLLAPLIMILPTALAVNEIVPSNLRALGLIPFVFYLPTIGLIALLRDVERRFERPPLTEAVQVILLVVLLGGGIYTQYLYFRAWASEPELIYAADGDLTAAAPYLDARLDEAAAESQLPVVYVAAPHYRHPTLAFLSRYYDHYKWLPQSQALVFPAEGEALYLYPANSPAPEWAASYLSGEETSSEMIDNERGQELFTVYELSEPPAVRPDNALEADFGGAIELLGYALEPATAGETMPVTLFWRVLRPPEGDLSPAVFVHLEDEHGHRWSQAESYAYPAEQWAAGETIVQRVELSAPAGMPPGSYLLRVGLFDPDDGQRLPHLDEAGRYAGDSVKIEGAAVSAGAVPDPLPRPPVEQRLFVTDDLELLGYERGGRKAVAGEPLDLALWWLAGSPLPQLSTRLSLRNSQGGEYALLEGQPAYGDYPFAEWQTPQFVIDRRQFRLLDDLPAGVYRYALDVLDATGVPLARADLGPLTVEATERVFTPPPVAYPTKALFGEEIRLLGYDLTPGRGNGPHDLALVWQAEQRPSADYTVFVHLLYPDGTCCAWQSDAAPRQNGYPTSRWLPGEVVVDPYRFSLPDGAPQGEYPLEVGLYLAETGRRLPATGDPSIISPGGDAVYLLPVVNE